MQPHTLVGERTANGTTLRADFAPVTCQVRNTRNIRYRPGFAGVFRQRHPQHIRNMVRIIRNIFGLIYRGCVACCAC
jgi:hypothetical protein